ncbi:hypothetical protein [Nocardia salmonicida]|uniref:hypothetical protein n=1 Tax=Nocardia salmonicida TaxID=53431 RepID=UPI0007A4ACD8|nr:hypothetical protein [Nocardia salmonicida]MBC7299803.1 hypothetical protein [Nocardia sp.]
MAGFEGGNPVLAPLRRWVLYSRTNLTITIAALIAALVITGMATAKPQRAGTNSPAATSSGPVSGAAMPISYDLVEISESMVTGKPPQWVTASAPATAMSYAHTFVDQKLAGTQWTYKLGILTAGPPGDKFLQARPKKPVTITGPTRSEPVTGDGGARAAKVSILTDAGPLIVLLTASERRWTVSAPYPTLDLAVVGDQSPKSSRTPALPPSTTQSSPTPSGSAVPSTPKSSNSTPPPANRTTTPAGPPPTGDIPLPELDTPLPGAL